MPYKAVIFFVLAAVIENSGAEGNELTMLGAYELSSDYAPDIDVARFKVDGAVAKKNQARGKLLPQINLFGQWSKNHLTYTDDNPLYADRRYSGARYGVSARQPLFAASDGLELNRQNILIKKTQEELRIAEAELLSSVVQAYLNILIFDAEVSRIDSEVDAIAAQLEQSKALYDKNLLPVTEVLETQSRLDTLKSDLTMASGEAAVSREVLANLTGLRGGEPRPVRDNFSLINRFSSPEDAAESAINSDPAVAAAKSDVYAAEKAVQREKSRWIPDVAMTYSFQHSDVGFDNLTTPPRDTSVVALDFRYPLFEGGAKFARIKGASAEYGTAVAALRAQENSSGARARSSWLVFEASAERLTAARQAVRSSAVNVTATRKAVLAGTAKPTDILLALAQNSRANKNLTDAKFFHVVAWLELELAAGAAPMPLVRKLSSLIHGE